MGSSKPSQPGAPAYKGKCPVCGAPGAHATRPFCSSRCADVDLSRWLRGAYAIPAAQDSDDEADTLGTMPASRKDRSDADE